MSEFDDFKHLWKYRIGTSEKVLLGVMIMSLVGILASGSVEYGFVGSGAFLGLMFIITLKHS